MDAALKRDELSVVDTVFVLEAPLPLHIVSMNDRYSIIRRRGNIVGSLKSEHSPIPSGSV